MKKIVALSIALMLMLVQFGAFAEMGVQLIGGPETESEPVSLDDIKLNEKITISGFADFNATEYTVQDALGYYKQGNPNLQWSWDGWYVSGQEAEFVILHIDLTNLSTSDKNFLENADVKVVFDDTYEYGGWYYQLNYNNGTYDYNSTYGVYNNIQNREFVIDPADNFAIGPMYSGHYFFGCTLPNAVLESKAPLRMEINIGGNEITYNIRK